MVVSEEKPTKMIKAIKFGILSPDEIRKMSVTAIVTAETYSEDGTPIEGSIMDPKLGIIEPGKRCPICGNTMGNCPGHFGHIELALPVIHPEFARHIYDILRATCRNCGRLKIPQEDLVKYRRYIDSLQKRWPLLAKRFCEYIKRKAMKVNVCPHCGEKQYKIKFEKPATFYEILEERREGEVWIWEENSRNDYWDMSGAIIIQMDENFFYIAGTGITATFNISAIQI